MPVFFRRVRFLLRWVVFYNIRLVWLNWRLPRRIPDHAGLDPDADDLRQHAQLMLTEAIAGSPTPCADCGRCCTEEVDRFTPFDHVLRARTDSPAPSHSRRIYSVSWMAWNAVSHTAARLSHRSHDEAKPNCRYLGDSGCSLSWQERPMLCVSWFCHKMALAMDHRCLGAVEMPLRLIETLHQDALSAARTAPHRPRGRYRYHALKEKVGPRASR